MTHIMEVLGKTKVYIENEQIIKIGESYLEYCPLFKKMRNIDKISKEEIEKNINYRINKFGLFTNHRILEEEDDCIHFGVSEILSSALKSSLIDVTITVCDGAGTVITNNPILVQAIGGHMSGLIQTEPIKETINGIEKRNGIVVDKLNATIDQLNGVKKAIELGYKNIAVTVLDLNTAIDIRDYEKSINDTKINIILLVVHTSGMTYNEAKTLEKISDIITLCASKNLRKLNPIFQVGVSIPLFAFTKIGKLLLIERMKYINETILATQIKLPQLHEEKQPYDLF